MSLTSTAYQREYRKALRAARRQVVSEKVRAAKASARRDAIIEARKGKVGLWIHRGTEFANTARTYIPKKKHHRTHRAGKKKKQTAYFMGAEVKPIF
jgi:hypothetical protein